MARSVPGRPAAIGKLTPGNRTVLRIGTTGSIRVSDIFSTSCTRTDRNSYPFHANYEPTGRVDSNRPEGFGELPLGGFRLEGTWFEKPHHQRTKAHSRNFPQRPAVAARGRGRPGSAGSSGNQVADEGQKLF